MGVKLFNSGEYILMRGQTQNQKTLVRISEALTMMNSFSNPCNAFFTKCEEGYQGVTIIAFYIDSDTIYLCDKNYLENSENWNIINAADRGIYDPEHTTNQCMNYYNGFGHAIDYDTQYYTKVKDGVTYYYTNADQNQSSAGLDNYIGFYLPNTVTNIYINGSPLVPPTPQGDATCKVNYYLQENDYEYSKLTFKEDTPPVDMNDGYVQDISASQSFINIENLVEGQKYYFTIFTDKSESEPFPYIVGPVITDWVNAELPSPMLCGTSTKPYRYENQELISDISDDAAKALGYDAGETAKWLFDDLIPSERTSRAFWIFGNNQRGIYAYYHNISNQGVSAIKIYYKNTIIVDQDLEWIASTPVRRNGILYFGKNDITCKGSIIYLSFSTNWFDTGNTVIKPFLINDTNAYYFITGRPNPADYTWYINNINGTGFRWKDWQRVSGSGYLKFPFSDYTQWRSDNGDMGSGDFNLESNGDARVFQTEKSRIDIVSTDYVTYTAILNPVGAFENEYYDGISTYQYYTVGRGYYYRGNYIIQGMTNTINGYPYTATGTLEEVLDAIRIRCKNVSIYVNGVCWSEV